MSRALVLGGGGIAGIGWEAGLVTGLREAGVDLGAADLVVGTSAGSVVGAMIRQGADLRALVSQVAEAEADAAPVKVDMEKVMQAFMFMYDASMERAEARRRVGALAMETAGDGSRLAQIADRLPSREWPEAPLMITAVDAEDGSLRVWEAGSGAPLPLAVASSCCVPCVFAPVEIGGRRYIDGGVHSISNADLAAGHDRVVIVEPLAHLTPRAVLRAELARLEGARTLALGPDQPAIEAFGADVLDPGLWIPAFDAGLAQAPSVVEQVAEVWG
ncbi:patatin-like phospholipase family protein [Actinocorallia populi]|uniref:patatin-like phospholipase family protein n=1 Tax=Actinocorallia populi TaxID=2079200 RepID=UPI000D091ADF|nr:patatin-like phospholipase family protein [Actinocorallia populi]